jgi:hypothetical protein
MIKLARHYLKPGRTVIVNGVERYRCPAGPGLRPIPAEGRWYDMTSFLHRRVLCGDAVIADADAPRDELAPNPVSDPPAGDLRVGPAGDDGNVVAGKKGKK